MAFTKIVSPGIDTTGSYTVQELNTVGVATAGTVQVGAATTVHTTGIDLGSGNITSHNINSTGSITAASFVGPVTGNITGDITATSGTFSGNVSIGGTLTYEDVTNIDSVGIITAQAGIRVTGGSVGIGTDNPATDFHLHSSSSGSNSEILLTNGDTGSSATDGFKIALNTGAGGEIWNYENDYIRFGTNNIERLRITSAGLVGVNCTPLSQFQVKTATNANIALTADGSEASIEAFNDAGSANVPLRIRGSEIKFKTSTTERLRITSTGKLEAYKGTSTTGKTSGSEAFTVGNGAGNHRFAVYPDGTTVIGGTGLIGNYNILLQNDGVGVFDNQLLIGLTTGVGVGGVPADLNSTEVGRGFINISRDDTSAADHILFGKNGSIAASMGTDTTNTLVFKTGTTERLRIRSSGQVEFKNGSFSDNVDCVMANGGTMEIGAQSTLKFRTATNERLRIASDGTTTASGTSDGVLQLTTTDSRGAFIRFGQGGSYHNMVGCADGLTSGDKEDLGIRAADNIIFATGGSTERLRITSTGEVTTTNASNIAYTTDTAANTRSLVYSSLDPQRQQTSSASWYILKSFYPNKSGTVSMQAEMYIKSGSYYFSFRVREEGTNTIVFNAGDNGGYSSYENPGGQSGNVHSYKRYAWICPNIKADKIYYIEMAATNSAGGSVYASSGQYVFLKEFKIYSLSGGHSDRTGSIMIQQQTDIGTATANSGTIYDYASSGSNRDSINSIQNFAGTESIFLGWFTTRAYNRYLDIELSISNSVMWFAQAYGYLYSRGQVAGSMISGYTYSNNTILNKNSHTIGTRGWYGSYRTSAGNLCLKFDSGGNGYSEGKIALFLGTQGPSPDHWRVTRYKQNDSTSNAF